MNRNYIFLLGKRVDNLYVLNQLYETDDSNKLIEELINKYKTGILSQWLNTLFPRGINNGYEGLLNHSLDIIKDRTLLYYYLRELCQVKNKNKTIPRNNTSHHYIFIHHQRIDNIYQLRELIKKNDKKEILEELFQKYQKGELSSFLLTQIPLDIEQGHFKKLLLHELDIDHDINTINLLLSEICDIRVNDSIDITVKSKIELEKRKKLEMTKWYSQDDMQDIADWEYVVLDQNELINIIRKAYLSSLNIIIHLCNMNNEYDFKGMRFRNIHFIGHGNPIVKITDPKLSYSETLYFKNDGTGEFIRSQLILENIHIKSRCYIVDLDGCLRNCIMGRSDDYEID